VDRFVSERGNNFRKDRHSLSESWQLVENKICVVLKSNELLYIRLPFMVMVMKLEDRLFVNLYQCTKYANFE